MKYFFITLLAGILITSCERQGLNVELVEDTRSNLGEGAIWNPVTNQLYWVDITGKILNIYTPRLGVNHELYTGQMIGTVVPAQSGMVVVALQSGFYYLDPATGTKSFIANPEEEKPENRFNDGKCDPAGRFWVGSMSTEAKPGRGTLYRFDPDSTISRMVENVSVSNGIAWSNDHTRMYYVDTPTRVVSGYDYDNVSGSIRNGKPVIEIPDGMGYPDGMTIDSDGNLWICLWGGGMVGCWNPETGDLLRTISVPAKNVTSCAFGDDDLGTLYITTARVDTSEDELKKYPYAGSLFKVRPGVTGVPAYFFADSPPSESGDK
jgi:sugar lactone lactonase YvrE